MLCSKCSQPLSPVVAVDIDGTLGDYHGHFLKFAANYLGWKELVQDYDGAQPFKKWFCEAAGVDLRTYRDIKLAYRQGAMKRSMPMFDGANRLTDAIVAAGAELWLTTTRPYLRLDNVDPDTRWWLDMRGIRHYTGLVYADEKYRHLSQLVDPGRVVAVVDDLPEMVEQASQVFHWTVPILRKTKWNAAVPGGMSSMEEITTEVVDRINDWRSTHE